MRKNISSSFLLVSKSSEVITSFRGPMNNFPIVQSINREKGVLRRWIVFSQGKRSTLVKYLFGKLLWDELNSIERRIFWSLSEITSDNTIFLSLKALNLGTSRKDLRNRLERSPFKELWYISRQQYVSIKGRVNFFFLEEEINLRKVTKYSGYTKHYKDKGHLGTEREYYVSEVLDPFEDVEEEILLNYLSVGKISLFGREYSIPEEDQKSPKRNTRETK